jgi:hypothetical protein
MEWNSYLENEYIIYLPAKIFSMKHLNNRLKHKIVIKHLNLKSFLMSIYQIKKYYIIFIEIKHSGNNRNIEVILI